MPAKLTLEQVAIDRAALVEGQSRSLRIVSDVQVAVPPAGRLALFGPSGSGKSSLLRVMNRLDDPAEGRVLLDGDDLRDLEPTSVRRRVGMVFQQPHLFDRSVWENMAYPLQLHRQPLPRERAAALLAELALPEAFLDRRAQQLSGGQQQRVAIARALVLQPEVLLLDEPSSALDEESARIMMETLLRRNKAGLTLVMVTHAPEILRRLDCPTLLVHDGRAQRFSDAESALRAAAHAQIRIE